MLPLVRTSLLACSVIGTCLVLVACETSRPPSHVTRPVGDILTPTPTPIPEITPTPTPAPEVLPTPANALPTPTPAGAIGTIPYGIPVPNKPGFVTSPHSSAGYVDVRGFPPGTEVKDPYSGKIFLVP